MEPFEQFETNHKNKRKLTWYYSRNTFTSGLESNSGCIRELAINDHSIIIMCVRESASPYFFVQRYVHYKKLVFLFF